MGPRNDPCLAPHVPRNLWQFFIGQNEKMKWRSESCLAWGLVATLTAAHVVRILLWDSELQGPDWQTDAGTCSGAELAGCSDALLICTKQLESARAERSETAAKGSVLLNQINASGPIDHAGFTLPGTAVNVPVAAAEAAASGVSHAGRAVARGISDTGDVAGAIETPSPGVSSVEGLLQGRRDVIVRAVVDWLNERVSTHGQCQLLDPADFDGSFDRAARGLSGLGTDARASLTLRVTRTSALFTESSQLGFEALVIVDRSVLAASDDDYELILLDAPKRRAKVRVETVRPLSTLSGPCDVPTELQPFCVCHSADESASAIPRLRAVLETLVDGSIWREWAEYGRLAALRRFRHERFMLDEYLELARSAPFRFDEAEQGDLLPDAVERLLEEGFLLIPSVLSVELCKKLHRMVEIFSAFDSVPGNVQRVEHLLFTPGPKVWDLVASHPTITSLTEQVFNEPILSSFSTYGTLPGGAGRLHVDGLANLPPSLPLRGLQRGPPRQVTAIVFLNDFDAANGGTSVVPKSHKWVGTNPYSNETAQALDAAGELPITQVTGPAGSVLFIDSRLWHRASINKSPQQRISLQIMFSELEEIKSVFEVLDNYTADIIDQRESTPSRYHVQYTTRHDAQHLLTI